MEIQDEEDESALIGRRFSSSSGIIIIRRWSVDFVKSFLMMEWRPVLATSIEDKDDADYGAIKGISSLNLSHLIRGAVE